MLQALLVAFQPATTRSVLPVDPGMINWLAVVIATVAAFFTGGLWYSVLFGKPWIASQGYTPEQVEVMKANMNPVTFFGGMLVSYFVLATMIAVIVVRFDLHTPLQGIKVGLALWVAVAAVTMTNHLASNKKFAGYLIDVSCDLVYLVAMGAIIGSWW